MQFHGDGARGAPQAAQGGVFLRELAAELVDAGLQPGAARLALASAPIALNSRGKNASRVGCRGRDAPRAPQGLRAPDPHPRRCG